MPLYLLDTNHAGETLRKVSPLRDRIQIQIRSGDKFGFCWPVLCELEAGIVNTRVPEDNRRAMNQLLKRVRIWPFDWPIVRSFGRLSARARAEGRALSFVDLVLSAMATELNAVILSSDKDFSAFPELDVESWL